MYCVYLVIAFLCVFVFIA